MKNILRFIVVIGLLLLASWLMFIRYFDKELNKPMSIEDNKVLLKSVSVGNSDTLYWYKYSELFHSSTMNFIAIAKHYNSLTPDSASLQGEEIQDVYLANDTVIVVSESDLEVFDKNLKFKQVKK